MMNTHLAEGDVYLKPGELFLPWANPARVLTVLGSCVAVALHDAQHGRTSLCHAVYPGPMGRTPADDPRYVEDAIALMLRWHRQRGTAAERLVAKLFGGAGSVPGHAPGGSRLGMGHPNVQAAHRVLAAQGVSLVAEDVGGRQGRRLVLHPATGTVHLYRLGAAPGESPRSFSSEARHAPP